jgi:hypothetical protein
VAPLQGQVEELKTRISELRKFLQVELHAIELEFQSLKSPCRVLDEVSRSESPGQQSAVAFVVAHRRDSA